MDLISQIQGLGYSFGYAFVASFIYHFINRALIKIKLHMIRWVFQMILGSSFAFCYYYGLVMINEGVIKLYFIGVLVFGYLIYELYFNQYLIGVIDKMVKFVKYILLPIHFVFKRFNAIMKNTKRVMKWKRKEENHS